MYQLTIISFGDDWAYGTVAVKVGELTFSRRALVNVTGELAIGQTIPCPKEFVRFQEPQK